MESPGAWSQFHLDLDAASSNWGDHEKLVTDVLNVLDKWSRKATREAVSACVKAYQKGVEDGVCGSSLPMTLDHTFSQRKGSIEW